MNFLRFSGWCLALILLNLCRCDFTEDTPSETSLFRLLSPSETGVKFSNTITTNDSINLLNFEYMYNGGGVGSGDFNNDGLPDLVFTGNQTSSRIYLNLGDLRFEDVTEKSGFNTQGKWCTGVSITDINYDGLDDIYVCVGGPGRKSSYPNLLFVNQGDGTFRESAAAYGLADAGESNHAVFFDFDRDGDLDLYLLNGGGFERSAVTIKPMLTDGTARNTDKLYENTFSGTAGHPVFADVSRRAGITYEGFGLGVGIIDANEDNWPDIYVSNDYLSKDLLYLNNQDGTFSEAAERYFGHTSQFSMGNCVGDIDNDGHFDLITLDMLPEDHFRRMTMFGPNRRGGYERAVNYGYGHQQMRNMLHLGGGNRPFREVGQFAGIDRTDWSWSPLMADLDNDGLQDLYVTNGYGENLTDLDFVKFRQDAVDPFSTPEESQALLLGNLEDLPAIVLANYAYRNEGNLSFTKKTDPWGLGQPGISNGAVAVDLDLDGDLEIITNNINENAFIYRNYARERAAGGANFLRVELRGANLNPSGIGARIVAYTSGLEQLRQQQPSTGYQSSGPDILHFGFGRDSIVDSLRIVWPDGKQTKLYRLPVNQSVTVTYNEATRFTANSQKAGMTILERGDSLPYVHREVITPDDFATQPLLHHAFTNLGPGVAVGDVNGDGRDDAYLGGAYGGSGSLLVQTGEGTFTVRELASEDYEDTGAVFFDADGDGDADLYVASGGSERYAGHQAYQDRLYLNDGRGNLTVSADRLPPMLTSTGAVAGADFNGDGATDLFVGGRVVPGKFPQPPRSYLLKNVKGTFVDVTHELCPDLAAIGMVTSAIWTDFNNDDLPDLMVVGEFMKISVFRNDGGYLTAVSDEMGLEGSSGLWNSIEAGDFDNDGDTDYVVGNIGRNTPYEHAGEQDLRVHFADFDGNGTTDPVFSMYDEGAYFPFAGFDMLAEQLPGIKKDILYYRDYARRTTKDILGLMDTSGMETLTCRLRSSMLLENLSGKRFSPKPLPWPAQLAPVKGILVEDFNLDGRADLLLVGNDYQREVTNGRMDASAGTLLINEGSFNFRTSPPAATGINTTGDTRAVAKLSLGLRREMIIITKNNGRPESYLLRKDEAAQQMRFRPDEVSAELELADGRTQKLEYHSGGGYFSQSSRTFSIPSGTYSIGFKDAAGRATRKNILTPKKTPL